MKLVIESVPDVTDEKLNPLLCLLPEWRRSAALAFRYPIDSYLCARSFLILRDLLRSEFGIAEPLEISRTETGKPFLPEYPKIHFNLSHCRKGIACAAGKTPIGIDIEEIQFDPLIADNVLSGAEREKVLAAPDRAREFTRYWTQKEAFLKFTGEGLADNLKEILRNLPDEIHIETRFFPDMNSALSIAGLKTDRIEPISCNILRNERLKLAASDQRERKEPDGTGSSRERGSGGGRR